MKKLLQKSLFVLVAVAIALFSIGLAAYASDISDLKDKKNSIDSQIEDKQSELDSNEAQQEQLQEQMDEINANIDAVQAEIDKLYADLAVAEENLANQKSEYETIKSNLEKSQSDLRSRINAIYCNGDVSYLDVLFSSEDIQDFISGFIFVKKIVEQDQSTIETIQENKVLAEEKLKELQNTRNEILALQEQKESEEEQYMAELEKKAAIQDQLESTALALEKEIDEMSSESASIASEINSYYAAQSASGTTVTYTGNGQFGWPLSISGRLTSPFGYRTHPISGTYKMHTGIDLAAPSGTPILAAESGTVIRVQYNSTGYGYNVIIDHGSNICTLYAHMSSIIVQKGQTVTRGQKIGGVGTTGSSTGNHLHFEVRVNGSPVNPLTYIQ